MDERNVDIREQYPKGFAAVSQQPFDFVITVCDQPCENCPTFPGKPTQIHWSIPDPASVLGAEEERLAAFRLTAGILGERIHSFLGRFARNDTQAT